MSWFEQLMPSRIRTEATAEKRKVPEGLWHKCKHCDSVLFRAELERNLEVCPKCTYHNRISARKRLDMFLDLEPLEEIGVNIEPVDILKFKDSKKYKDRISAAQKTTGEKDALIVMKGRVKKISLVAGAFDFSFMGGSMGAVVGERFILAADTCMRENLPLVVFSASGGARMQEALFSLMQMAKTSAALAKMREKGLPFISILTDPTMGGVSASFGTLGDVILAEPNALIGFAGPRVIEQTVREKLPEGFQRSEFLLEHGAIDRIVDRRDMREEVASLLTMLMRLAAPEKDDKKPPMAATETEQEAETD